MGAGVLQAQYARPRGKGPHKGPRAIAVLEPILPPKGATKPSTRYRIVPVTIFYEKQYYDASIYKASPVPMALQPETVYDVEQGGSPKGSFAVDTPSPTPAGWQAEGSIRSAESQPERKAALGTANEPKGTDDPPRLRRGGDRGSTAQQPANTNSTSASPSSQPANGSGPANSSANPGAQPAPPAPVKEDTQEAPPPDDPNRPRLQRGKPAELPKADKETDPAPARSRASAASPAQPDLIAVSDVQATDPHIYTLQWPKNDLDRLAKAVTEQAQSEMSKYVKEHFPSAATSAAPAAHQAGSRHRASSPAAKPAAPEPLQELEIHYFDLDFDNDPEIVVTGSQVVAGSDGASHTIFVTYISREEGGRDYHPLLRYITDDTRLDEFPRLRLIDAVDADGDGVAELLFRASNSPEAEGRAFRLYATGPDRLRIVFDSQGAQD
jgi:hypothetical protein